MKPEAPMHTKTDTILNACLNHWGASAVPFSNAGDETLFATPATDQALALLQQTAALRSVMVLSGPNGIGKSALVAHWVETLNPKSFARSSSPRRRWVHPDCYVCWSVNLA